MNTSSWDFSLANYGAVWAFLVQVGLLLIFLMIGNILRRKVPLFRNCLIPSALLGGGLLLVTDIICKHCGFMLVDNRMMQVITYHCLAIGFAAMSLKTEKSTHKTHRSQVFRSRYRYSILTSLSGLLALLQQQHSSFACG